LLAELVAQVFSVERHSSLAESAGKLLTGLGYTNVSVVIGDGARGLPAYAPFDAILVSAAALHLPPALPVQLREGGRMIIPIGSAESQQLHFIRMVNGQPISSLRELVRFVPLLPDQD
jgi:protein-L-isoaspartate(D-aspartate) O-methyltransferase